MEKYDWSRNKTEDKKERLSEIIADINAKTGANYDVDVATGVAMQIRDIMMKSDELKISARNNSENDFKFSYFSNVEDALIEGLDQNQGFFSYLLNHPRTRKKKSSVYLCLKSTEAWRKVIEELNKLLKQNLTK